MTMSYNILFWHILGYFQFHPATWKHWFHLYILIMPHRDCWCNSAQILVISKLPEESTWRTSSYRCFRDVRSVFCFTSLDSLQEQDTIQKLGAKCVDVFPMINDIYIYIYMCVTYGLACLYLDVCVVPHVAYYIIYLGVYLNVLHISPDFKLFR